MNMIETPFAGSFDGAQHTETLNKMLGLSKMVNMESNLFQQLEILLQEATYVTNAERSTLYLLEPETGMLSSYIAQKAEVKEIRLPVGQGIAGVVAETGKMINLPDAYDSSLFDRTWDQRTGYRTKSVLCVPMLEPDGSMKGVIQVLNQRDGLFTTEHEHLMTMFAAHAAITINTVQLHQKIKQTFLSGIRALAAAVDCRDPVTAGHTERVTFYAVKLGRALKLDADELAVIEYAATLHDIGLISIPDEILTKDARLTDEEFEVMKKHTQYTRQITEKFEFSGPYAQVPFIAASHHERIDGSGYPDGLKEDDLPLASRIIAVADSYDSVTTFNRNYRKALSTEDGLKLLMSEAGTTLDAEVVHAFISNEIYRIERRHTARISLDTTVRFRYLPRDRFNLSVQHGEGKTLDLSHHGLRFTSSEFVPCDSFIEIQMDFEGQTLDLIGKAVRVERLTQETFEVAVSLVNLSPEMERKLSSLMVELRAA